LEYLRDKNASNYDIELQAMIQTEKMTKPQVLTNTNFKYLYWSMKQQLVHHSITGCNMMPGDLLGSGTISGTVMFSQYLKLIRNQLRLEVCKKLLGEERMLLLWKKLKKNENTFKMVIQLS
jgi:2-keto-4-pentenoate hydratase/2-oxohepta-3-ene-1,7-dioic acid hydratase in catechol pathway